MDVDGTSTFLAGLSGGSSANDIPALEASLGSPKDIAVDGDGNIYIADTGNLMVRMIDTSGIIRHIAGNGVLGPVTSDGGSAVDAIIGYPVAVAADNEGNVYINAGNYVKKIDRSGIITTIAGNGLPHYNNEWVIVDGVGSWGYILTNVIEGSSALDVPIGRVSDIEVNDEGEVFLASENRNAVFKIDTRGKLTTVAGDNLGSALQGAYSGDNGLGVNSELNHPQGIGLGNNGEIYIADFSNHRVRRVGTPLPGFSTTDIATLSEDGSLLYRFDQYGKHLSTINSLTGSVVYTFAYDAGGLLISVTDLDGDITTIERDADGNATAIVAHDGQRTTLTLNANGYLASITNPASEVTSATYTSDGLMTSFTNPRGGVASMQYDALGRLTRDVNPAGGSWDLLRTVWPGSHRVDMSTALGRTTSYYVEALSTGDQLRINTAPTGLSTTTVKTPGEVTMTTLPDGTFTTVESGPDPRFGMLAPVVKSFKVTTPAGLSSTITNMRTANLTNPLDPLSLTSMTDTVTVNGRVFTSAFDKATLTATSTTPLGRQMTSTIDANGRPVSSSVPGLAASSFTYDTRGRLATTTQGAGIDARSYEMAYDLDGNLESITDPLSRSVSYSYDAAGRVTSQTLTDGRVINYSYDEGGNVTSITPPSRPAHSFTYTPLDFEESYTAPDTGTGVDTTDYTYDLDKKLTLITRPDAQTVSFNYDITSGRLDSITTPSGATGYAYDAVTGKLSTVTAPDGGTLSYTYDGFLALSESYGGTGALINGSVNLTYDNNFRATRRGVNLDPTLDVNFTYDNDGLLTGVGALTLTRDAGNGLLSGTALGTLATTITRNTFGETSGVTATSGAGANSLFTASYTRDKIGRITSKTETVGAAATTFAYTYDLAGRLTDVTENGVLVRAYSFDSNGNRLSYSDSQGAVAGAYDAQDRLQTYGANSYTYNANGELVTKTNGAATMSYSYDVLGNLRSVTLPDATQIDYIIDGRNRRIGKKVGGVLQQGFIYGDQLNPIAELNGAGAVVTRFVYATKGNVPDYMVTGGVTYRIISDHLGSPRLVVNSVTGAVAQRLDYDEFGNVTLDTAPSFQPFGFAGGLFDADTGLTRFGARDYDAEIGRWTSKDPIKFAGGDTNLYGYVLNDPVNWVDPWGLNPGVGAVVGCSVAGPVGAIVGAGIGLALGYGAWEYGLEPMLKESKDSGKDKASDAPSWAKGKKPKPGESGKDFADRLMDDKYGKDNYPKGAGQEHSKIKKWADRRRR